MYIFAKGLTTIISIKHPRKNIDVIAPFHFPQIYINGIFDIFFINLYVSKQKIIATDE